MRPDLMGDVATLLAVLGAAMQWLRAQKRISDAATVPLGVLLALVVWVVAADWESAVPDWQAFILRNVTVIIGLTSSLFGGTFMASRGAEAAVALGANPGNYLVPLTDSKGGQK